MILKTRILKLLMKSNFNNFNDMDFPVPTPLKLQTNLKLNSMQNILFLGKEGSGRTTKMRTFLSEMLGDSVHKISRGTFELSKKGDKFIFFKSNYHTEIDFRLNNIKEKEFYNIFLKDYGQTMNIAYNIPKILVLKNCEKFTHMFEKKLCCLIDKYHISLRLIFISSKKFLLPALTSRTTTITIPSIKRKDVISYLLKHSKENKISITEKNIEEIVDMINNNCLSYNLKSIFELYEMSTINGKYASFYKPYTTIIDEQLEKIFNREITLKNFQKVREVLFDLYVNLYNTENFIKYVNKHIYKIFGKNYDFMSNYTKLATETDRNIQISNKDIIHIEKFMIGLIVLVNKYGDNKFFS